MESQRYTKLIELGDGLELDDSNYVEYYAVGIRLTKILSNPHSQYEEGQFIEVSYEFNRPKKIINAKTSEVLWQDDKQ